MVNLNVSLQNSLIRVKKIQPFLHSSSSSTSFSFFSCNNSKKEPRILVFSKTLGYRHESIEADKAALVKLGSENDFKVDTTENSKIFNEQDLERYSAIVFLSTTGETY